MRTLKTDCGCEINVINWSPKRKIATVKQCSTHKAAPELLEALRRIAYEPFGPADASVSEVLEAITECARSAITKAEGK